MEVSVEPTLSVPTKSKVVCVEFSPYEWSKNLLAVALSNALNIYSVKFQEETEEEETELTLLLESQIEGECCAIAWSPDTSIHSRPSLIKLVIATIDDAVLLFTSDLTNTSVKEIFRHSSCINSVACSTGGNGLPPLCASVGDDQVLRVWHGNDFEEKDEAGDNSENLTAWQETMMLMQPGQSVKFHPENPTLLLVTEVSGTIRMYSINPPNEDSSDPMLTADWSIRCPAPTLDVDWSLCDPDLIVAATPSSVAVINVDSHGSVQKKLRPVSSSCNGNIVLVRASRSTASLVAATTADNTITVMHLTQNRIPLTAHLQAISGMTWHLELPYLAVGSDRKLLLWRVDHIA